MNTKHTPGPWSVDDECRVCAGNQVVATVHPRQRDANTWDWDRAERDACLIAAAPRLLAAAALLIASESPRMTHRNAAERRAHEQLRAAIAAARGQA